MYLGDFNQSGKSFWDNILPGRCGAEPRRRGSGVFLLSKKKKQPRRGRFFPENQILNPPMNKVLIRKNSLVP